MTGTRSRIYAYLLIALGFCAVVVLLLAGQAWVNSSETSIRVNIMVPDPDHPTADVVPHLTDSHGNLIPPAKDYGTPCEGLCPSVPQWHSYEWSHPDLTTHSGPYTMDLTSHGSTVVSREITEWSFCTAYAAADPATMTCMALTPWYETDETKAIFIATILVGAVKAVTYSIARIRRVGTWIALAAFNAVALFLFGLLGSTRYPEGSFAIPAAQILLVLVLALWDSLWLRREIGTRRGFLIGFITGIVTGFGAMVMYIMYDVGGSYIY